MYNEYPTIYESNLNQYLVFYVVLGIIFLAMFIFTLISMAKVFKKANRSGISAFIPIYNLIVLLEITNLPKYYFILLLIPGVNIVFNMLIMFELAKLFRKGKKFAFGLTFLPFFFYPILAFDKGEYIGINLVAMEKKSTVIELPKVVNEEETPVVNESFDDKNKNVNISIGGGVYQKDYTNTLINPDTQQIIVDSNKEQLNDKLENNNLVTNSLENSNNNLNNIPINQSYIELNGNITNKENDIKVPNKEVRQNIQYVNCPQCGALISKSASSCFLCGKNLQ